MLFFYNFFFLILHPFLFIFLKIRSIKGKEHSERYIEKLGVFNSNAKKDVIWFHVSSLGEIKSIHSIIKHYQKDKNLTFLITSVTLSSYQYFEKYLKNKNTFHQFAPLDSPIIISKFLKTWKPRLAIFVESEIWPNMILQSAKRSKLILLNCRISQNSFKKWKLFKSYFTKIMTNFDYILAQSKEVVNYLKFFKLENIKLIGNIKFTNIEKKTQNVISITYQNKSHWVAMSIHHDEIDFIINIHNKVCSFEKNLVTYLIPRHLNKINLIIEKIKNNNLKYQRISENKIINDFNGIVIVDQFGLADDIFNTVKTVFMGGSIIDHGGQNPLEAIKYGCRILTGKNIFNFTEIYNSLIEQNLAKIIYQEKDLSDQLIKLINENQINSQLESNNNFKLLNEEIFNKTVNFLNKYIY